MVSRHMLMFFHMYSASISHHWILHFFIGVADAELIKKLLFFILIDTNLNLFATNVIFPHTLSIPKFLVSCYARG